jgi:hypothetical protein
LHLAASRLLFRMPWRADVVWPNGNPTAAPTHIPVPWSSQQFDKAFHLRWIHCNHGKPKRLTSLLTEDFSDYVMKKQNVLWRQPMADVMKRGSLWRHPLADVIKTNGCVIKRISFKLRGFFPWRRRPWWPW